MHPAIEAGAPGPVPHQQAGTGRVRVWVRLLAGLGDEVVGTDLMNKAFGPGGPNAAGLSATKGEQEGTRALFADVYRVLRNPPRRRHVDYGDLSKAAGAMLTASLLMCILDRVEDRLLDTAPDGRPASLSGWPIWPVGP